MCHVIYTFFGSSLGKAYLFQICKICVTGFRRRGFFAPSSVSGPEKAHLIWVKLAKNVPLQGALKTFSTIFLR